jgi:hypothetical protein
VTDLGRLLGQSVHVDGADRPFGEVTAEQARIHADRLRAATGWGPMARVAPVAMAWRELSLALQQAGAARVSDLPGERVTELAPRLWVVPPGGSLLG